MLRKSISRLERWVEGRNYKGYEPFDGLSSALRPLTFGNLFAERILQQLVRQCPINLRPILGVKPQDSTKGRGYMAWGYLKMLQITGNPTYKEKAVTCLDWLDRNKEPGYAKHSWGNHFDFSSRGGKLPKHEPIIVWTSLIGQTFLDAYEMFGDKSRLETVRSICGWILDLPKEQTGTGSCLSYVAYTQESIHNSNMLGAAMLARAGRAMENSHMLEVAREAMEYSCTRQLADGSWYYGEEEKYHWVDNFHTGYNLDSLKCYIDHSKDHEFDDQLRRGFKYFKENFFEDNGRPKYYNNRVFPVDIQCASQAIDTLTCFSDYDGSSLPLATKVAQWTIENMQDEAGFFYYRELPWIKAKTPMLHWGQATMYKALASLLAKTCQTTC